MIICSGWNRTHDLRRKIRRGQNQIRYWAIRLLRVINVTRPVLCLHTPLHLGPLSNSKQRAYDETEYTTHSLSPFTRTIRLFCLKVTGIVSFVTGRFRCKPPDLLIGCKSSHISIQNYLSASLALKQVNKLFGFPFMCVWVLCW